MRLSSNTEQNVPTRDSLRGARRAACRLLCAVPNIATLPTAIRPAFGERDYSSVVGILGFVGVAKQYDAGRSQLLDHECITWDFAANER
jgi:hypothetical protein